ncbi:hypothetical protein [Kitasatospora sp. A2-31]|uniref:hypothetical protein n=1 Tax=Kitasatospora sp. A2-31 TaxID=2916414 RepID=UPI001EEBF159|nr:hypothetical protein [Kitasatospora sp. A2-31]MCG6495970.1 hypothetical protein [Kitasatospora sp. A2-31]
MEVKEGELVLVLVEGADHDPAVFPERERIDFAPTRRSRSRRWSSACRVCGRPCPAEQPAEQPAWRPGLIKRLPERLPVVRRARRGRARGRPDGT